VRRRSFPQQFSVRLGFVKCQSFPPKFSDLPKIFSLARLISKERYAKSQMQYPRKRTGAKAKIAKQSKVKSPLCAPLKCLENSF
jgi:hypothetical protein